ncbi:MAG: hypothetical protein HRU10_10205 [Opitutales bacterium]|nr:hypothetical protein [Opitutales bacterium]
MMLRCLSVCLSLFLGSLLGAQTGGVAGKVTLPERDNIKRMSARYRDADARFLGEPAPIIAVVYLNKQGERPAVEPLAEPALMLQKGLQFLTIRRVIARAIALGTHVQKTIRIE